MVTINSLLAGFTLSGVRPSLGQQPAHDKGQPRIEGEDTFTRGQESLNRAPVRGGQSFDIVGKVNRAYGFSAGGGVTGRQESGAQESVAPYPDQRMEDSVIGQKADPKEQGGIEAEKSNAEPLSGSEKHLLDQLKAADREVKDHERAHLAAAGGYAKGGASYQYRQGPDGKKYAVGGEVSIDIGKASSPEQTIEKMRVVRRAALAPAHPSPQDQRVAARATMEIAEAAQELRTADAEEDTKTAEKTEKAPDEKNEYAVDSETKGSSAKRLSVNQSGSFHPQPSSFLTSFEQNFRPKYNPSGVDLFA